MDGHSIKFRPQVAHKSRATSDMDIIFTIQLYSAMMVKSALTIAQPITTVTSGHTTRRSAPSMFCVVMRVSHIIW